MMQSARCSCAECRALDQLPDRLQGWPGAWQSNLFLMAPVMAPKLSEIPDKVREACADRCSEIGGPPCYEPDGPAPVDAAFVWRPCGECLRDCGIEPGDEYDAAAAVGDLFA